MILNTFMNVQGADKGSIGHDFCKRYEPHFHKWRMEPIELLECGIQNGLSARGWLDYFPNATIHGVDVLNQHGITDPRFSFVIGNQRDQSFWGAFASRHPQIHIAIDDAEHRADASKIMFECVWPLIVSGGTYAIEDCCTWMDEAFISPIHGDEWIRFLFSELNWHGKDYGGKPYPMQNYQLTYLEQTLDSIELSKHLVILKKK